MTKYDQIAEKYDELLAEDDIATKNREQFQNLVLSYVPLNHVLVDFGAGTGIDAVFYAKSGYDVILYEPSQGMRRVAEYKIRKSGLSPKINIIENTFEDLLETIAKQQRKVSIVSNFGAINHMPIRNNQIGQLATAVSTEGYFIHYILKPFYIGFMKKPSFKRGILKILLGGIISIRDGNTDLMLFRVKYMKDLLAKNFELLRTKKSFSQQYSGPFNLFISSVLAPVSRRSIFVIFKKRDDYGNN